MKLLDYAHRSLTEADLPRIWNECREGGYIALDLSYNEGDLGHVRIPADLPNLEYLYLYKSGVSSVELEDSLPRLSILHLGENKLTSFRLPAGFPELEHLRLDNNQLETIEFEAPEQLRSMRSLFLKENNIGNLPEEIWGSDENCWEKVRSVLQASSTGAGIILNHEVKVIWFGNGEAGKTTLSHQLRENAFKPFDERTHGILINDWHLPYAALPQAVKDKFEQVAAQEKAKNPGLQLQWPETVTLKLWDFGGQEYYHATHRLFLSNNALYLLVWEEATERQDEERGIYPRQYWVQNIQNYATQHHTILEVQNKVAGALYADKDAFQYKVSLRNEQDELSVLLYNRNIEQLKAGVLQALGELPHLGQPFPKPYDAIRGALGGVESPYLSFGEYERFCQQADPTAGKENLMADPVQVRTLTEFLHDTGHLICYRYRKDCPDSLKELVFLNPKWVTDGIYRILDRERVKNNPEAPGEFDLAHVADSTQGTGLAPADWVDLMKQFELIFEKKGGTGQLVAPQYLAPKCIDLGPRPMAKLEQELTIHFTLYYPGFLPKSVITRFISRYGNLAEDYYWKYGIVAHQDAHAKALIVADYTPETRKSISVRTNDRAFAIRIFETLHELNDQKGDVELYSEAKQAYKSLKEIHEYPEAYRNEFWFVLGEKGAAPTGDIPAATPAPKVPEVFISYAWGQADDEKEVMADQIEQALQQNGLRVIRDKTGGLGYKGKIREFMQRIGQGNIVVCIISDKYLRSENCMFELLEIAKNEDFYDRIFPVVLPDAQIYKPVGRIGYIKYWEERITELDEALKELKSFSGTEGLREDIDLFTNIRATIAKLTDTLRNMNTLSPDTHRQSDFKQLIDAIQEKLSGKG